MRTEIVEVVVEIVPSENEVFAEDNGGVGSRPVADKIYIMNINEGSKRCTEISDILNTSSKAVKKCVAPTIAIGITLLWYHECRFFRLGFRRTHIAVQIRE